MFWIAIYGIVGFTGTYMFLFGVAYLIKACAKRKTEPEEKVLKIQIHELKSIIERTFSSDHSTWLGYILRKSVYTLDEIKLTADRLNMSTSMESEESTVLQDSLTSSYCNTLQTISIISQVAVELETFHKNDAFLISLLEYLKRHDIYEHMSVLNMVRKFKPDDFDRVSEFILKAQFGVEFLEKRITHGSLQLPLNKDSLFDNIRPFFYGVGVFR